MVEVDDWAEHLSEFIAKFFSKELFERFYSLWINCNATQSMWFCLEEDLAYLTILFGNIGNITDLYADIDCLKLNM